MALPWDAPPGIINWEDEAEKYYRMAFSMDSQEASTALALRRADVAAKIGLLSILRQWVLDPNVRRR